MLEKVLRPAIRWGVIGGILTVLWMLLEYLLGFHDSGAGRYTGYMAVVIAIGMIYAACARVRASSPDGRLTLAQGLLTGVIVWGVAGTIIAAWLYYYLSSVNPGYVTRQLAEQERELAARGLSTEETLRRLVTYRDNATPARQAMWFALTAPIGGAIFGLLDWFLLRRPSRSA